MWTNPLQSGPSSTNTPKSATPITNAESIVPVGSWSKRGTWLRIGTGYWKSRVSANGNCREDEADINFARPTCQLLASFSASTLRAGRAIGESGISGIRLLVRSAPAALVAVSAVAAASSIDSGVSVGEAAASARWAVGSALSDVGSATADSATADSVAAISVATPSAVVSEVSSTLGDDSPSVPSSITPKLGLISLVAPSNP